MTYFKGLVGAQIISGNELSEFNNVRFENSMVELAFLSSTSINIYGVSDFYKGIFSNTAAREVIIFEADAAHVNTNDERYVDGYIKYNGSNEFQFPIGDGGFYSPSAINQVNSFNDLFRSRYIFKNSNTLDPHTQKDNLILKFKKSDETYKEKAGYLFSLSLNNMILKKY